jgi:hypothetical protein
LKEIHTHEVGKTITVPKSANLILVHFLTNEFNDNIKYRALTRDQKSSGLQKG